MGGVKISILVVDDDPTCLNIITKCLQIMNYQVIGMTDPVNALSTLRETRETFDLIVTDVHMPQMSGLELLRLVGEEFQLPVVLMSADGDKDVMLKGLEQGASFYFIKPINPESLQKLWQFAISGIKSSSNNITNASPINATLGTPSPIHNRNFGSLLTSEDNLKSKQTNLLKRGNVDTHRAGKDGSNNNNNNGKKPKLIWTTFLHNQFLEAVNKIGIDKAVPKKILEQMNVPGLKRENVASHLQKYRIFLKRISEISNSSENSGNTSMNEKPMRSGFVLNEISYLTNNLQQQYKEILTRKAKGPTRKALGNSTGEINPKYKKLIDSFSSDMQIHPNKGINHRTNDVVSNNSNDNYVGLRISTNGELAGATDLTNSCMYGYTSNNNISQDENNFHYKKTASFQATLPAFNNKTSELPDTLFGTPKEIMSGSQNIGNDLGVDFTIQDNQQGSTFKNDFEFEPINLIDYGVQSCFDTIEQGYFMNDDMLFDTCYAKEFEQQNIADGN